MPSPVDDFLATRPKPKPLVIPDPEPPVERDRVEAMLERLSEAIAALQPPDTTPAEVLGNGDAIALLIDAISSIPTGASADELAEAIAARLPQAEPGEPVDLSVLARLEETLKTLDFRLRGVGGGGGPSTVSLSSDTISQLSGSGSGGGLTDVTITARLYLHDWNSETLEPWLTSPPPISQNPSNFRSLFRQKSEPECGRTSLKSYTAHTSSPWISQGSNGTVNDR